MPIGPFETFADCVSAQIKKGKDEDAAKRICGAMERESAEAKVKAATLERIPSQSKQHPDAFLVRAFLIDPSLNINKWAVTAESIPKNINTFIGKPLVLTDNYDHPGADVESLSHWLAFQETYRVGTITGIVPKKNPDTGSTAYHAIIEVTDKDVQADLRNSKMPLYVSPAIAQPIDSYNASVVEGDFISEWTGIHLAIVSEPAFGVKKAVISDVCEGNRQGCLLQLRKAHVNTHGLNNCGFCRKGALQKYHKLMIASSSSRQHTSTSHAFQTSPSEHKQMSQLEPMDSNAPPNNQPQQQDKGIEKVEELHMPPNTKQPVVPPVSNTPTNLRDLLEKYQQALHEIELRDLKINELTEAHTTVQDRIAALELRDRRKDIERIITPDIIKDDKQRLEKIKTFTSSSIPINEIEELYKDLKVTIKKASVNNANHGGRVPYITSNLASQNASMTMEDEETGLTPLQKQMKVLQGGF